jgi:hypothetical protein
VWRVWSPFSFIESSAPRYVLSLLNQPIADHAFFLRSPMLKLETFPFFPIRKVSSCLVGGQFGQSPLIDASNYL